MRKLFLSLSFFLFLLPLSAQAALFTQQGETAVIVHTRSTRDNRSYAYHEQYTDPGAVLYHEGQFHMFRNGFNGWPATVWIHYMVSDDGINWTQPSQEPVLHTDAVPYAEVAALASSVLVAEDGTWLLYFYTWNQDGSTQIGRATASSPDGEWIVDPEPVLVAGEGWESVSVGSPQVIKTETGYQMYYSGTNAEQETRIGLATSSDGITWERFAENPILAPSETWEGGTVHQPRVVQTENGYLMAYRAWTGQRGGMAIGLATSSDGITWTRSANNPSITMEQLSTFSGFWYTALEEVDGRLYLYLELNPRSNVTDIYLFTAEVADIE